MAKRTKRKSKGLGDTVEKITEATGIKTVVEKFTKGKDCGCAERKKMLNKLFPYNKPECLTEEQYNNWKEFKDSNSGVIKKEQQDLITGILRDNFNMSVSACSTCGAEVWLKWIRMIDKVYETYE